MPGRGNRGSKTIPLYVRKTTQLPSSLKDELVSLGKIAAPKAKGQNLDPTTVAGRKQRRKQEQQGHKSDGRARVEKDVLNAQPKTQNKRSTINDDPKGKKRQRIEEEPASTAIEEDKPSKRPTEATSGKRRPLAKETPLQKLLDKSAGSVSGKRPKAVSEPTGSRSTIEEQEDAEIAWLEAQLGLRKNSKSRKEFEEDGLDDLLEDLDTLDQDLFGEPGSSDGDESESANSEQDEEEMLDESESESEDEDLQQFYPDSENDEMEGASQEEAVRNAIEEDEQSLPSESGPEDSQAPLQALKSPERLDQSSISKYIPPALRKAQQAASLVQEEDPKLRRQLMGLLNRLSPTSFPVLVFKEGDVGTLNGIYLSHPRAVVSKLLVTLIPEIVSAQGDGIGETQIVVLAALVKAISSGLLGGMSASGGVEFGATLVDHIIREMDRKDHTHKERSNLIHFLAMLYNMQVIACTLLYDMIKESISNGLSEDNVDALVKIVRVSGPQLRHDDPTSLKQIIQLVSDKQKTLDAKEITIRTKFMIEQLSNLKNNKTKAATGVASEAEVSLRKYISGLAKKSGHESEPLRMSLVDLRAAGSKGKWWLVGAAWSGNPLVDQKEDFQSIGQAKDASSDGKEALLLKLARKQGMNTETRRQIFVAVTGAEDYIDAAERVSQLGLKEVQQREIVRVLLHCFSNEKVYNPFYTLVVFRLLTESPTQATHSYQITLQYALWDFFRSLGEEEAGGASMTNSGSSSTDSETVLRRKSAHYAKAYAWWCAKAGLSLNILKPLPFPRLLPASNKFLATFFTNLFTFTQTTSPLGNLSVNFRRDEAPVEKLFLQLATHNATSAQGIGWYLRNAQSIRKQALKNELLAWGVEIALETLEASERMQL